MKSVVRLLVLAVLLQILFVVPPAIESAEGQVTAALSISDASGPEAGGLVVFTVTRSGNTVAPVTATYTTTEATGTATPGNDYDYPHPQSGSVSFAANDTSQQIMIVTNDDSLQEANETFEVQLTSASALSASISDGTGIGTIVDDDVFVSIADLSKLEGTGGTTQFGFPVSVAPVSPNTVTVTFATVASGSATAGADYQPVTGTAVIPEGQSQVLAPVAVIADNIDEVNETFNVNLTAATNAGISDGQAIGTIQDDDGPSAVSVNDVSRAEGTGVNSAAVFTLSLDRASSLPITVTSTTQDRTGTVPSDYLAWSGTTTFAPGETSKQLPVTVVGDGTDESDETFALLLQSSQNATINDSTGIATIIDDDPAPTVSIGDATGAEGTVINFPVSLSAPSGRTVTVTYTTAPGTALAGADYAHTVETIVFSPGQVNQTASVSANTDAVHENNETFSVNLSSPVNAVIADGQAVGTILDDGQAPHRISIGDVTGPEGTVFRFPVTLDRPSPRTVTVVYETEEETAYPGMDYTETSETLVFSPGQVSQTATVSVSSDTVNESRDETFKVLLFAAENAAIGDAEAIGTIVNVVSPGPELSIGDASALEGDDWSDSTSIVFPVSLSYPSPERVEVAYETVQGTAIQDVGSATEETKDYYGGHLGYFVMEPGMTSAHIPIGIAGDFRDEDNETFDVRIRWLRYAQIGDGVATGTIVDDDPKILVSDVSVDEGPSEAAIVQVTVPHNATTVAVDYATADSSAKAGSDYSSRSGTLVFAPGETTKEIAVSIRDDGEVEDDEVFFVNFSNARNAFLPKSRSVVTIHDDDYEEAPEDGSEDDYPLGYWMVASDGGIFTFGDAGFYGSMGGTPINQPVVGMDSHPDGEGYWLVAADGGIFTFGHDVGFYGSMGGTPLAKPVVGMAATPTGNGYWLVASDGGVFTFGDAGFYGSLGGQGVSDAVAIVAHPDGDGYWVFMKNGRSAAFGSAHNLGTRASASRRAVGADLNDETLGAYVVDSDGAVYNGISTPTYGDMRGQHLNYPMVGMTVSPYTTGYWLGASDGGVFTFGDVPFLGSMGGVRLNKPVVGIEGLFS